MLRLKLGTLLLAFLILALIPLESHSLNLKGRRQSKNVIDLRKETKAVNAQLSLETGRRYLVAMLMMAEKDANELPECVTLNQELEKLKTVRVELEGMGMEPIPILICSDEAPGSRINLCAQKLAKDPAAAPAFPDLKEFEAELEASYGPALEQVGRMQASLNSKNGGLAKEEVKCRASLQLIQKKSAEIQAVFNDLHQFIRDLTKTAL